MTTHRTEELPLVSPGYLTRHQRLETVDIPQTTAECVIVKPNNEGIGFRFDQYVEHLLAPKISKDLFD